MLIEGQPADSLSAHDMLDALPSGRLSLIQHNGYETGLVKDRSSYDKCADLFTAAVTTTAVVSCQICGS